MKCKENKDRVFQEGAVVTIVKLAERSREIRTLVWKAFTGCRNTKVIGGFGWTPKPCGAAEAETTWQEREDTV